MLHCGPATGLSSANAWWLHLSKPTWGQQAVRELPELGLRTTTDQTVQLLEAACAGASQLWTARHIVANLVVC
jgi:hypothetical protein